MERWNDPVVIFQKTLEEFLIRPGEKRNSFYEDSHYILGSFEPSEVLERMGMDQFAYE